MKIIRITQGEDTSWSDYVYYHKKGKINQKELEEKGYEFGEKTDDIFEWLDLMEEWILSKGYKVLENNNIAELIVDYCPPIKIKDLVELKSKTKQIS